MRLRRRSWGFHAGDEPGFGLQAGGFQPFLHERVGEHCFAVGLGCGRERWLVGHEAEDDRGVHGVGGAEVGASEVGAFGFFQGFGPDRVDAGDVCQDFWGLAGAGGFAEEAHGHVDAEVSEAGMHFGGDGAGVGSERLVRWPQGWFFFGAVFADGQAVPDVDALVDQVGDVAAGAYGLDAGGGAAGQGDEDFLDVEAGEADGEPAAEGPGGIALGADVKRVGGHDRVHSLLPSCVLSANVAAIHSNRTAAMNEISPRPNNLDAFWMPYSANRSFKSAPRMLARAEGMYYYTQDNREVIDGTAGLWCCNAGHGRREITEAIQKQAAVMDFAPTFQMGHPIAFQAAARVAEITPEGLDRVFFTNSGSESADTALKIALAYHRARGESSRVRLIGRERGYHGVGFGGMSVGGIGTNRKQFGALLPYVDHLPHTHSIEHNAFTDGQPEWGAHLADTLLNLIQLHGAETIAAVMVEPLAGSTGVLVPPKGYLQRLRDLCTANGILLIYDEVITGFGRLGTPFGAERLGVAPDIMTMAKGLTNAAVPMGAVACHENVYSTIVDGAPAGIELFHGYTYSGHPLASAAAIASIDLHRTDDLAGRALSMEGYFGAGAHAMRGLPNVIDVRNMGLVAGIELQPRAGAPTDRAVKVFQRCFDNGVLIRTTGDIIALSPPLIIENKHVDRIFEVLGDAIRAEAA